MTFEDFSQIIISALKNNRFKSIPYPYLNSNSDDDGTYHVCLDNIQIIMRDSNISKKDNRKQDVLNEDFDRQYPEKKRLANIMIYEINFLYSGHYIETSYVWCHIYGGGAISFALPVKGIEGDVSEFDSATASFLDKIYHN